MWHNRPTGWTTHNHLPSFSSSSVFYGLRRFVVKSMKKLRFDVNPIFNSVWCKQSEFSIFTFSSRSCTSYSDLYSSGSKGPQVILWGPFAISSAVNLNWATNSPENKHAQREPVNNEVKAVKEIKPAINTESTHSPSFSCNTLKGCSNSCLVHSTTPRRALASSSNALIKKIKMILVRSI